MMLLGRFFRKKARPAAGREPQSPALRAQRLRHAAIGLAFLILVPAVTQRLSPTAGTTRDEIDFEAIPQEDIRAEHTFQSEDLDLTRKAREEAAAKVSDRYFVARLRVKQQLSRLQERLDALAGQRDAAEKAVRDALLASNSKQAPDQVVQQALTAFAAGLIKNNPHFEGFGDPALLAVWLRPDPKCLPERQFDTPPAEAEGPPPPAPVKALAAPEKTPFEFAHLERLAGLSRSALEYTLAYGILNPNAIAAKGPDDVERSIVVRRDQLVGGQKDTEVLAVADVPVPVTARQALLQEWMIKAVQAQSGAEADTPLDWTQLQDAALAMAKLDVAATLVFDEPGTEGAKEAARNEVPPVMRTIQRDARIQEGGMPWTEQTISDYTAYQAWRQAAQAPVTGLVSTLSAHMVLVALILACLVKSLPLLIGDQSGETRDLTLVLLIMCVTILLGRVALYFDPSGLLVPAAAGAILLAILTNARLAAWASLLTAVLLSIQFGYNWALLVVYSAMAFAGVLSIFVVRRRNDMASAAIKATLVGVLAVVAITLATGSLFSERTFHQVLFVGVNGIICLLAVPALLSPLERLFAITTDIQLLEYSDLNNEVLSRLAIEVPATYAHSLMLGQLAEAAAVSIGANGLLARVCAYYHDIGKLRRPEYFTENQTGANVHDGLSPRLSARAIASHVAEGAEMAREFHLPKPMIDAIYEHHGTCLISFFYQDALAQQKHGDVREADFRYAGPKPQSRETAILMICDAVESGVRSIKNPNEERIRELVDKIVSSRAADRQFDESDLTLKDLDTIKEVVTRRMLTSLHGRVAYPDEFPRNEADNVIPMSGGSEA